MEGLLLRFCGRIEGMTYTLYYNASQNLILIVQVVQASQKDMKYTLCYKTSQKLIVIIQVGQASADDPDPTPLRTSHGLEEAGSPLHFLLTESLAFWVQG